MSSIADRLRQLRREAGMDLALPGESGPGARVPSSPLFAPSMEPTVRAGLSRSCPIPSRTIGTFSRQREKERGTGAIGKFPDQREQEIPGEPSSSRQVQDSTPPLTVIPTVFNSRTAGQAGIQLEFEQKELDPGLRRDDEQGQHSCELDDAPPRRLALRAIRDANVRAGILPAPSGLRRDDEKNKHGPCQLGALRRLIRRREIHRQTWQPRHALLPAAGDEIAPGLHSVETRFAYPACATLEVPAIDQAPIDRRRLLCFDTETTGLAGGVGTRAFMIGVAAWADDVLTVRQLYLTAIAGERAMLQLFADWLQEDTILVSYNGKSYDAPLLKGRLRLNRVAHRLAELPHIDWLHPTRRIYKGHLPNCKLATIEREVLRIVREDDLPGSEAPAAWLAFLRGQSSRNLARVIEHNRQDVITLMRLGDHLTSL